MGYSSLDTERKRKGSIESHKLAPRVEEVSNPRVELVFDSIARQFGEQGRMPDYIESSRNVQKDSLHLMTDIEGVHSMLGE